MKERRKQKCGSSKENGRKHRFVEQLTALILCAALLVSNTLISRADDDAVVTPPVVESTGEQQDADTGMPEDAQVADNESITEEQPSDKDDSAGQPEEAQPEDAQQPEETDTADENGTVIGDGKDQKATPEELPAVYTWEESAGDMRVKVTAQPDVLPEDAQLHVREITEEAEINSLEKTMEEKAVEEQFSIQKLLAVDISFTDAQGSEIQPRGIVSVGVDHAKLKEADTDSEMISVFHVDADQNAQDMGAAWEGNGEVVFETPHFSTYVIIQQGDSEVVVTVEHYGRQDTSGAGYQEIYKADELTLPVGGMVPDYAKAVNWQVEKVDVTPEGGTTTTYTEEKQFSKITVTKKTDIRVYYVAKQSEIAGATTFYDYTVRAGRSGKRYLSINEPANYGNKTGKRLMVGDRGSNYSAYQTDDYQPMQNGKDANIWTGDASVVTGLLSEIDDNGNPVFAFADPGFFENSDVTATVKGKTRYLRKIYRDDQLIFRQTGDTYVLDRVQDKDGNELCKAGNDFFPLDGRKVSYEEAGKTHNFYFGMRYDVTFKLGDYKGPLNYSFTGDDDLWVVLDKDKIVIDLGGIHSAATGTVDLWDYIDPADTEREHTLTVLYMERGAGSSNCQMNFTLPSARISGVTDTPMSDLLLYKVNSDGEALEGAQFKLVKDGTGEIQTATSKADGSLNFTRLTEGEYQLSETKAPSKYIPTLDTWVVKVEPVEGEEGSVKANLYLSDGETLYTKSEGGRYEILNLTEQERIDSVLDYDKTAKVKSWEDRTYDITITASSKLTSQTTQETGGVADVMMVLDISGSMLYDGSNDDSNGFVQVGSWQETYKDVKNSLDATKVYYYGDSTENVPFSYWSYYNAKSPMIYRDGKWLYHTRKNGSWKEIADSSTTKIYTIDSGLTGLKEAGNAFVNSIAEGSPTSRIGIKTFHSNAQDISTLKSAGENRDVLVKDISALRACGGTSPQKGLDLALKELTDEANEASTVPKYVILFTDGAPSTAEDKSAAELSAQKLREKGIILYTVGLKLTTATETWLSQKIASEGCALSASSTAGLKDIFKTISSTITEDVAISKAEIRDVIDPRFQLVKDDGTVITDAMLADGETIQLDNGGIVYLTNVNGKAVQAVKWTEQTIPNKKNGTWEQTVTVKAREEYIGGNHVPTNIAPDSSISTGYGDATLPQPKVNVKAELTVSNAEQTIFLGDTVPTADAVLKQLFDADSKAAMGVTADDFTLTWYRDEACTDEITVEEMGQVKPADTTEFYLKVVYDPGEPSDESNRNTTEKVNGKDVVRIAGEKAGDRYQVIAVNEDEEKYPDKEYGVYTVYVVDGKVTVVKTISNPAEVRDTQGSPIFTFRLTRTYEEDGQTKTESFYRSMKADKDGETKVVFSHLPKGTYTVEELAVQQYEPVSLTASADETGGFPCHMAEQKMEIGSDGRENRLQERDGLVQAVNKKTPDHHETSNDIIINQFAVKDGKVIITPVKTEAE